MTKKTNIGAFVQGSPHPAWLAHSHGRCLYANPALRRLTGLTSAQLTQMRWLEFVVEEDRQGAAASWPHSRAAGIPYRLRVSLRSTDPSNSAPVDLIAFGHHSAGSGELWYFTALNLHALTQRHPPLEAQLQATLNVISIHA